MTVYIDNGKRPFRSMRLSRMIADSQSELLAIASVIGFTHGDRNRWLRHVGTDRENFDICQYKRRLAIKAGAVSITQYELTKMVAARRRCWTG